MKGIAPGRMSTNDHLYGSKRIVIDGQASNFDRIEDFGCQNMTKNWLYDWNIETNTDRFFGSEVIFCRFAGVDSTTT